MNILGYSSAEILGQSLFSYIKADEIPTLKTIFSTAKEHSKILHNMDFTMIHRNGYDVLIETNAKPIINSQNKAIGYRGINRDITLWKKNQERQQQLLDIIEASPDFIATADSKGNTTYLNPSARFFLGISESTEDLQSVNAQLWTNKFVELNENGISNEKVYGKEKMSYATHSGNKFLYRKLLSVIKLPIKMFIFFPPLQEIYQKERHMKQLLNAKHYTIH